MAATSPERRSRSTVATRPDLTAARTLIGRLSKQAADAPLQAEEKTIAPIKCFVTFRLRPGVTLEQYQEWFQTQNLAAVAKQRATANYRVWRTLKVHEGRPTWQFVEEMDVLDLAECEREFNELPEMSEMLQSWHAMVADQAVVFTEELPQQ